MERRHLSAGLQCLRGADPRPESIGFIREGVRCQPETTADVSQIRSKDAIGESSAHGVACATAVRKKQGLASHGQWSGWRVSGFSLVCQPALEIGLLLNDDGKAHERMRSAAILGADSTKQAGFRGVQDEPCYPSGNHVHLASEGRNPEGMDDIGTLELELYGLPEG